MRVQAYSARPRPDAGRRAPAFRRFGGSSSHFGRAMSAHMAEIAAGAIAQRLAPRSALDPGATDSEATSLEIRAAMRKEVVGQAKVAATDTVEQAAVALLVAAVKAR